MEELSIRERFNKKFKSVLLIIVFVLMFFCFIVNTKVTLDKTDGGTLLQIIEWINNIILGGALNDEINFVHGCLNTIATLKILPGALALLGFVLVIVCGFVGKAKGIGIAGLFTFTLEKLIQVIMTIVTWIMVISFCSKLHKMAPDIPSALYVLTIILTILFTQLTFWFNIGLLKMSLRANLSYITDENHYKNDGYVVIWSFISAFFKFIGLIFKLIGHKGAGILFAQIFTIATLIMLAIYFIKLNKELGEREEGKVGLFNSPKLIVQALKGMSIESTPRAPKPAKEAKQQQTYQAKPQPQAVQNRPVQQAKPIKQSKQNANLGYLISEASGGKTFETSSEVLDVKQLKLFGSNFDEQLSRYSVLGSNEYNDESQKNVKISKIAILKDNISQRKILRIEAINNLPVNIKSISFSITPMGHIYNELGIIDNIEYQFTPVSQNEKCLAEYGIMLPDDTSICDIKINKITFEDGLFIDDDSEKLSIETKEKLDFDKKLYMEIYN